MSYSKQTWTNGTAGGTFDINGAHLQHIEDGIEGVDTRVTALEAIPATPDASSTVKGKVQLTGDLGGTAASPTVPGLAAKAADSAVVHTTGAETVAGIKTFSSSPVVPTPTTGTQAVNKTYADGLVAGGAPDATGGSKGIVQLAGDLGGTAASPTVPGLAGKAATSHTHAESDVTNLVSDLAGKAATSHTHAAADIASGTVATSRLGSGAASSTTFLRGDSTWATPAGGGGDVTPVVRQYAAGAWPTRGVPTTTPVIWDGPDTSPPPIDVNHAYGGTDTLDVWLRRSTS